VAARRLAHQVDHAVQLGRPQDAVDLGNLLEHVGAVALGEAAGDDERPAGATAFELGQLEDGVHRLLARPIDEGAGVDDEALGLLGARGGREAGRREHPQHQLGIDLVLGAA
jgi:hypothetical protein